MRTNRLQLLAHRWQRKAINQEKQMFIRSTAAAFHRISLNASSIKWNPFRAQRLQMMQSILLFHVYRSSFYLLHCCSSLVLLSLMRNLYNAIVSVTKIVCITLRKIYWFDWFIADFDPVCSSSVHVILNKCFYNISAKYSDFNQLGIGISVYLLQCFPCPYIRGVP